VFVIFALFSRSSFVVFVDMFAVVVVTFVRPCVGNGFEEGEEGGVTIPFAFAVVVRQYSLSGSKKLPRI
jgi:hypothetical protein